MQRPLTQVLSALLCLVMMSALALPLTGCYSYSYNYTPSSQTEQTPSDSAGSQQPVSEPTSSDLHKQALEAVTPETGRPGTKNLYVSLGNDRLNLVVVNNNITEADVEWVMSRVCPILKGSDAVLSLDINSENSDVILPLQMFTPYFDFASLSLSFDSGHCLRTATGIETLTDVSCLRSLDIGQNEPSILPTLPQLETLKLDTYVKSYAETTYSFAGLNNTPALQVLIVSESGSKNNYFIRLDAISQLANLRELVIYGNTGKLANLDEYSVNAARDYYLCEAAMACASLSTIQNRPLKDFDLQVVSNDNNRQAYLKKLDENEALANAKWGQNIYERYRNGQIAVMSSVPVLDGPFILWGVENDGSIPSDKLRTRIAGGDVKYVVFMDYRQGEVVKRYTNGGEGREMISFFYIYDIANDMVSPDTIVAVTEPPDSFMGVVGSDAEGEKLPEAALPHIKALLR